MSTISVVIPAYNAARYLGEALASVEAQRRPAHEIIVVDDGSTDDTRSIAAAHGARCIQTGGNRGPSRGRNLGVQAAVGDVVAFLDADDWWEPEHTELVVGLLDRFPEAGVAFGRVRRVGTWDGESDRFIPEERALDVFWTSVRSNIVPQMAVAVRRDVLLAVGGYEESMRCAEDYDLWLRLSRRHRFVCTHRITANYRGHASQVTAQHRTTLIRGAYMARQRLYAAVGREAPELKARLAADMRGVWSRLLREAWRSRDSEYLAFALGLAELVPGSGQLLRRWRLRARLMWHAWLALGHVWDAVPTPARSLLRQPLQKLMNFR